MLFNSTFKHNWAIIACASTEMFCSAVVSLRRSDFQRGKGTSQIPAACKAGQENQTILPLLCARCQQRSHQASIPHTGELLCWHGNPQGQGLVWGRRWGCWGREAGSSISGLFLFCTETFVPVSTSVLFGSKTFLSKDNISGFSIFHV